MKILSERQMNKMTHEELDEYATKFMHWSYEYENKISNYLAEKVRNENNK